MQHSLGSPFVRPSALRNGQVRNRFAVCCAVILSEGLQGQLGIGIRLAQIVKDSPVISASQTLPGVTQQRGESQDEADTSSADMSCHPPQSTHAQTDATAHLLPPGILYVGVQ